MPAMIGDAPLTNAERQRRHRERLRAEAAKRMPPPTKATVVKLMKRIARLERALAKAKAGGATGRRS
jgi:hypothetical protein